MNTVTKSSGGRKEFISPDSIVHHEEKSGGKRQELKQTLWKNATSWLASMVYLTCFLYVTQDHLPGVVLQPTVIGAFHINH